MSFVKYRVWDKVSKTMNEWDTIAFRHEELIDSGCGSGTPHIHLAVVFEALEKTGCVFSQATGLKDSQKKEIYEGDILQATFANEFGSMQKQMGVMERTPNGNWMIGFEIPGNLQLSLQGAPTIIGNVWQNPELIKK